MSKLRLEKVIGDVPGTLEPDCVYAVRAGAGYDLRVSDMTGTIAHKLNLDTEQLLSIPESSDSPEYVLVIQGGEVRKAFLMNLFLPFFPELGEDFYCTVGYVSDGYVLRQHGYIDEGYVEADYVSEYD